MIRHRAHLLEHRDLEELKGLLKGKTWDEFFRASGNLVEIDGIIFRARTGPFMGQNHLAIMSQGQFVVMRRTGLTLAVPSFLSLGGHREPLDPRRPPYGWELGWFLTFAPHQEIQALQDALIIEEAP